MSQINFTNGARFKLTLRKRVPKLAREANDYLYLEIFPEKGRGEPDGYFINVYDATSFIWLLSNGILQAQEAGIPYK